MAPVDNTSRHDENQDVSENVIKRRKRMPGGRASVACTQCRKIKTRCHHTSYGMPCLRCKSLNYECSLVDTSSIDLSDNMVTGSSNVELKLDIIQRGVQEILSKMNHTISEEQIKKSDIGYLITTPVTKSNEISDIRDDPVTQRLDQTFYNSTPVRDITETASLLDVPFSRELGFGIVSPLETEDGSNDLIGLKILDETVALSLFEICYLNYRYWPSFDDNVNPKSLFLLIRNESPLLLAVCCLVALRHYEGRDINTQKVKLDLVRLVSRVLNESLLMLPKNKYVLQSLALLTAHASTLSYKEVYFDAWYLSSYALCNFITREMNMNMFQIQYKNHPERINSFRVWNNLCYVHLNQCIATGRPCIIDDLRLDQCREILDFPLANNFDGRIVAKLSILLSLYSSLLLKEELFLTERELGARWSDWKYLYEQQPNNQFIELTYCFSKLMIYRRTFLEDYFEGKSSNFFQERSPITQKHGEVTERLISECVGVLEIVGSAIEYDVLLYSHDFMKFIISFSSVLLVQLLKVGLVEKSRVKNCVDEILMVFGRLSSDYNDSEDINKGFSTLIDLFSKQVYEVG